MKIFWLGLKKYWKITFLVIFSILGFFFLRKKTSQFSYDVKKINEIHQLEIKKIEDARKLERFQREESEKKYKETIALIKEKYEIEKQNLDRKKEKEVKKIIELHGKDPHELALQLSKATGFKVILPEEIND